MRKRAAHGLSLCVAVAVPGAAATGCWTGAGAVVLINGSTERVKCAIIYKVSESSTRFRQSLRCASPTYSVNAAATGHVLGRYTGSSFGLSIQGGSYNAAMNVGLGKCKQSINIMPTGIDVRRVSMTLAKC